jgi:anti-anti-sigma regulatory factor
MDLKKGTQGELVIEVGVSFDAKVAARLAGWLREIPRTDRLVIDFSQVRTFQDLGLACVARDLAARGSLLQVRGLTRHQERMMRYFGLELTAHPQGDVDPVGTTERRDTAKATA